MPQGDSDILQPVKRKWQALFISILILGHLGLWPASTAAASKADKTRLLKERMSAMETLRGQIGLKLIEASAIRSKLKGRIEPLELEIKTLSEHHQLTAFDQTEAYPRIAFGLKTLAHLTGYYEAIRSAIAGLREADHALQYLHRQVRDDLEVIATLSDFAIEAQITRIDAALDFPQAQQAHLIDATKVQPPSPASLFSQMLAAP